MLLFPFFFEGQLEALDSIALKWPSSDESSRV